MSDKTASGQLQTLLAVQRARESLSSKKLQNAISDCERVSSKGEELQAYMKEYEAELTANYDQASSAELLNYRFFLQNMNTAAQALEQQRLEEDKKVSDLRQEWVVSRAEKLALEKLVKQRQQKQQRLEQKQADQAVNDRAHSREAPAG